MTATQVLKEILGSLSNIDHDAEVQKGNNWIYILFSNVAIF